MNVNYIQTNITKCRAETLLKDGTIYIPFTGRKSIGSYKDRIHLVSTGIETWDRYGEEKYAIHAKYLKKNENVE